MKTTTKPQRPCPKCHTGKLVLRTGKHGVFFSCSNYPSCKHTENPSDMLCKENDSFVVDPYSYVEEDCTGYIYGQ